MLNLLLSVILCSSLTANSPAMPPAFSDISYSDALSQNAQRGGYLVVKFTAEWCGPCKQMDTTTWSDVVMVDWLTEHNITVIAVDTDKNRKIAQDHQANSIPLMVAFRDGIEFDRVVGYRDTDQMIAWLTDVEAGTTQLDKLRAAAGDRADPNGKVDIDARYDLAAELANGGAFEEAAEEYVWLWNNMLDHDPAMYGVRLSFMASSMEELAQQSEAAKEMFAELRDTVENKLQSGDRSFDNLNDWLTLNLDVLGDLKPVDNWIERIKDRPNAQKTLRRIGHTLNDYFLKREQWEMLGWVMPSTREIIWQARMQRMPLDDDRFDEDMKEMIREMGDQSFAEKLSIAHAALLAAQRDDEAWLVANELFETLDTPKARAELLRTTLRAGQVNQSHRPTLIKLQEDGGYDTLCNDLLKIIDR